MSPVTVVNDSGLDVDTEALRGQVRFMLAQLGMHRRCELAITLVDEPTMAGLHERWMGEPGPTDVLSFPMDELVPPPPGESAPPGVLGDIVVCVAVAGSQGASAGHGRDGEMALLVTHGILHLLGFDHAEPDEHDAMFARQAELIRAWEREGGPHVNLPGPATTAATDVASHEVTASPSRPPREPGQGDAGPPQGTPAPVQPTVNPHAHGVVMNGVQS